MIGFVKMSRDDAVDQLVEGDHDALILAIVIGRRARFSDGFSVHGLAVGEALIGDFNRYGMTEKRYRAAKERLEKYGFATFRATNKGTIASLTDTRLFDVAPSKEGEQKADSGRTVGGQWATNEEGKKEKNGKNERERDHAPAPPSLEQVKAKCREIGAPETLGERFFYHYGSIGWETRQGPIRNWGAKLALWHIRGPLHDEETEPPRNPAAPKQSEVTAVVKEKWGEDPRCQNWAVSFFSYWEKRNWKRSNGGTVDWQVELSAQVAKWKSAPTETPLPL